MTLIVSDGVFSVKTELAHNGRSVWDWTLSTAPLMSLILCSETLSGTDNMLYLVLTICSFGGGIISDTC